MRSLGFLLRGILLLLLMGCGRATPHVHSRAAESQEAEADNVRVKAEASAAGLISKEVAARHLHRISVLNTKLGEIPATLQRAADFPSQLKDYTLFQIRQMLEAKDFSLATSAQLRMAVKLIEDQKRLMEK